MNSSFTWSKFVPRATHSFPLSTHLISIHGGAKRPKNGLFRPFWYSLYISSPNLAYELAVCSRFFRHQDRHKILNDDVTNHDVTNIRDVSLFFQEKHYAVWKTLTSGTQYLLWQKLRELWQVKTKIVVTAGNLLSHTLSQKLKPLANLFQLLYFWES